MKYLSILEKYKEVSGYEIYGYCLMDNHIHLLFKEYEESIAQSLKRIGSSYVYWYNKKHDRCGHLFQDRFKSEVVEDDKYLLVVLRYIHQNPLKAGLVKAVSDYEWSSYKEYTNPGNNITDTQFILKMFDAAPGKALTLFESFMFQDSRDKCLEYTDGMSNLLSDDLVIAMIKTETGLDDPLQLGTIDRQARNEAIKKLREKGVTIKQFSQLTGINRGIVQKAGKGTG